jgi:WD40 repeat protein
MMISLVLWDLAQGKALKKLELKKGCGGARFTPDGKQVLFRSDRYMMEFWDVATGKRVRSASVYPGLREKQKRLPAGQGKLESLPITAFFISADGKLAVAATGMNAEHYHPLTPKDKVTIHIWDLAQDKKIRTWRDRTWE